MGGQGKKLGSGTERQGRGAGVHDKAFFGIWNALLACVCVLSGGHGAWRLLFCSAGFCSL